jgi:uncharacterized protein
MNLSNTAARALLLAAQGLQERPTELACKEDCLAAIRRMGLLQIDTISVVARSPYLVLWSRVGDYELNWLEELLAEGGLFEYWAHAVCFLPIEDFGLYRRRMLEYAESEAYRKACDTDHREAIERVLARIREQGEVRSADFEAAEKRQRAWWDWKPEKIALEHLFFAGELMIARRQKFQRVYDLRERVLPDWDDERALSNEEGWKIMTLKAIRALGIARPRWLPSYFPHYFRSLRSVRKLLPILEEATRTGELLPVAVEGWSECAYVHRDNQPLLEQAAAGALHSTVTTLLSPFDPVVSDRDRALELFGFNYRIETYTPAEKRVYGYFSLPILHRGALVGRLDAKAHRRERVFEVKSLHLEEGQPITDTLVQDLASTLKRFAHWHNTPEIVIRHSAPPNFGVALQAALEAA